MPKLNILDFTKYGVIILIETLYIVCPNAS